MNTQTTIRWRARILGALGGFALATGVLEGAPFLYSPGDLILTFRQDGNAQDYVVNLGKTTNYNTLPAGTSVPIPQLSADQLRAAFPNLNGLKWSVAAANRPPLDPNYPIQTLWVSRPRLVVESQSAPWLRKGGPVQGNAGSQIDAVGANAALASSNLPGGPNNTATGVLIPVNFSYNVGQVIGSTGNYANNFQGTAENRTPEDFDAEAGNVSRSDLYELIPGTTAAGTLNSAGRYLGYFEFKPNGALTFHTGSTPLPAPSITRIVRVGDVSTVSFTTVGGATYNLRATDGTGISSSVSTWSLVSSLTGNGGVQSLQDTSTAAIRLFAIQVLP